MAHVGMVKSCDGRIGLPKSTHQQGSPFPQHPQYLQYLRPKSPRIKGLCVSGCPESYPSFEIRNPVLAEVPRMLAYMILALRHELLSITVLANPEKMDAI